MNKIINGEKIELYYFLNGFKILLKNLNTKKYFIADFKNWHKLSSQNFAEFCKEV